MGAKTILICDDEAPMRQLVRAVLDADYEFGEVADGGEVLELAHRMTPDLLVLDVMIPGGGGMAVLARLRADSVLRDTPVVVLTAWPELEADALAAGADRFFAKPFEPEELKTAVDELLAER
jgi:CheY-like chemotaxis protein